MRVGNQLYDVGQGKWYGSQMKVAVWKTGHEIADTVAEAVYNGIEKYFFDNGLPREGGFMSCLLDANNLEDLGGPARILADVHIAYGILRGTEPIFRGADKWLHIDKGYLGANHFDGNYRISFKGTQQTLGLDKLEPDYEWVKKNIQFEEWKNKKDGYVLICPPSSYVCEFFQISGAAWMVKAIGKVFGQKTEIRTKDIQSPIDWENCKQVITFNSTVGLEALRRGIPVISDPDHSFIGAWFKKYPIDELSEAQYNERHKLFATIPRLQFTLEEAREGKVWQIIQNLISISDMTAERPQQLRSPLIASEEELNTLQTSDT